MNQQQISEPTNSKSAASSIVVEETIPFAPEDEQIADEHQTELSPSELPKQNKRDSYLQKSIYTLLTIVLLVAGGGFAWQWSQSQNKATPAKTAPARPMGVAVKIAPLETTTLEDTSEFVGTLESQRSVEVRSETAGRVKQIYVKSGDFVRQGETIFRIDSDEARSALMQAKANLIRAQARLQEVKAGSRPEEIAQARARLAQSQARLAEGQAGSRPEEIAQSRSRLAQAEARLALARAGARPEEIAQATAQVESAKAKLNLTSTRLKRNQELAQQGAISRDKLDEVLSEDRSARANLQEAQRRLEQLQNGTRSEEIAQAQANVQEARQALEQLQSGRRPEEIAQLKAAVEQEQQALKQLENGNRPEEIAQAEAQVAEAQAQVRTAEIQIENTGVRANFAGAIGDIPVKLGDYVKVGDPMTTLTQNQSLDLRLSIPIERQPQLRLGLPVQLEGNQNSLTGQIGFISPKVNPNSQSVLAKATFDNSRGVLKDGQFVRAKVTWNSRPNAVVVPTNAVIFQGQDRFVYVAQMAQAAGEQGKQVNNSPVSNAQPPAGMMTAKLQPIELGLVQGDKAEVVKGLQPGMQIVVSGTQKLADGAPIMPLPDREPGSGGAGEQGSRGAEGQERQGK